MKRLLTILIFSASFFASAQLINVVELNSPTGAVKHVYEGSANGRFHYLSTDYTGDLEFEEHSTIQVINGLLITSNDHPDVEVAAGYQMLPGFVRSTAAYISSLEGHGIFYNDLDREIILQPRNYLPPSEDPLQPLRAEWESSHGESSWQNIVCRNRYRLSYHPSGRTTVLWSEMNAAGEFVYRGSVIAFATVEEAYMAVQAHIIETNPCVSCTSTSAPHDVLNDLVVAADPSFNTAGFNAWIDREGNELRWNRIARVGERFVLSISVGAQHEGTSTSYDCLEELLDNLPQ